MAALVHQGLISTSVQKDDLLQIALLILGAGSCGEGAGLRQDRQEMGRAAMFIKKLRKIVGAYALMTYRKK